MKNMWREIVDKTADAYDHTDWSEGIRAVATKRLEAGTVRSTQYGTRVACREEFGDNRNAAAAYWPGNGCKCWAAKKSGACSHELAALALSLSPTLVR